MNPKRKMHDRSITLSFATLAAFPELSEEWLASVERRCGNRTLDAFDGYLIGMFIGHGWEGVPFPQSRRRRRGLPSLRLGGRAAYLTDKTVLALRLREKQRGDVQRRLEAKAMAKADAIEARKHLVYGASGAKA